MMLTFVYLILSSLVDRVFWETETQEGSVIVYFEQSFI